MKGGFAVEVNISNTESTYKKHRLAMPPKVLAFYQTPSTNVFDLVTSPHVTDIHLAAVHLGRQPNGAAYIHLNDDPPDAPVHDKTWQMMGLARASGKRVSAMVGGAGGGFSALFGDYPTFYPILRHFLRSRACLSGVNLDVEEPVGMANMLRLVRDLRRDLPPTFALSMAPLAFSLSHKTPGMGDFAYQDLEAALLAEGLTPPDYYTAQCYGPAFTPATYAVIMAAGWPAERVVMVGLAPLPLAPMAAVVQKATKALPPGQAMGGVGLWEWFSEGAAAPGWPAAMAAALRRNSTLFFADILYDVISALYAKIAGD